MPRPLQFRHGALRILSRPRRRASRASPRKNYLFREEFTARIWATRYDFPAIKDGRVKREMLPDETPSGAQGWFINTRRDKFKDPRVREALDQRLRFRVDQQDHHVRRLCAHAFAVPEFGHDGERAAVAGRTEAARAVPRPGAGRGVRRAVRAAGVGRLGAGPHAAAQGGSNCCSDAGFADQGRQARDCRTARCFASNSCSTSRRFQPHHAPYIKNLGTLGIEASLRLVDPVQYRARRRGFRFRHGDRALQHVGDAGRQHAAVTSRRRPPTTKGSYNLAGIDNPAIDALIEKIIARRDPRRAHASPAARFDRVFRAGRYWVPQWYRTNHPARLLGRLRPSAEKLPRYLGGVGAPEIWWSDRGQGRAKLTEQAK